MSRDVLAHRQFQDYYDSTTSLTDGITATYTATFALEQTLKVARGIPSVPGGSQPTTIISGALELQVYLGGTLLPASAYTITNYNPVTIVLATKSISRYIIRSPSIVTTPHMFCKKFGVGNVLALVT